MLVVSVNLPRELKEKMARTQEDWISHLGHVIGRWIHKHEMFEASSRIDAIHSKTSMGVYYIAESVRENRDLA